jgi:hypothetical protein
MLKLARLQTASGSWEDLAEVLQLIGVSDTAGKWEASEKATALALQTMGQEGDQYRLIADKGFTWLEQRLGEREAERILEWAREKLTA